MTEIQSSIRETLLGTQADLKIRFITFSGDTFTWPNANGNIFTNQTTIKSEKTHEVTRCEQALKH